MRKVLQMAQGRDLIEQMQREAQESQLPELIGMAVQLEFIRRGTAQQELMGQLATSIAADYIGNAEQEQRTENPNYGNDSNHCYSPINLGLSSPICSQRGSPAWEVSSKR